MEIELREERLDGPSASELVGAFSREIAALYPGWDPTVGPTAEPREFAPPSGTFLVAYRAARPVACGGVKQLDHRTAEIKRVYVVPDERGRGVGRLILTGLERAAAGLGCATVRLDTGDSQPDALALFRSLGYREIPDYNANPYASYWFEKSLLE